MAINDIYRDGIASGWKVVDASTYARAQTLEADVAIVGSGAGGSVAAEILSEAGLRVLLIEAGALRTSDSFKDMDEGRAYRELYQEAAARTTSDGAIAILQGRSVGGSTTVNWSSSFRTPAPTLAHWAERHAVSGHSAEDMAPWFARMEERLSIAPWSVAPNPNNDVLRRGCERLGWESHVIPRNVKGCWSTGYCGLGCPVNAKQSMLVSTIPRALAHGATLVHRLNVRAIVHDAKQVSALTCEALASDGQTPTGVDVTVKARHFIAAGGAINTPALLLRSHTPDPHERLGKRSFIHPVCLSVAVMPERVEAYYGAPQSVASDHFQWKDGATGPVGYKLEVPPMLPGIGSGVLGAVGPTLRQSMSALPHTNAMLALLRDGFTPQSEGGLVRLANDGSPILDYDMNDHLWDGVRRAWLSMVEAQFAAGAIRARPSHLDAADYTSWNEARDAIAQLPLKKFRAVLFTAHLMGGCGMSDDARLGVVDSRGRHHQLANLSVFDGSVFPTSIGANPQLSVFALAAQNATALAKDIHL
jgi:choline dehydrogenase-like flavoprotein